MKNKSKCSKNIWGKFSDEEKKLWENLYDSFLWNENFPPEWKIVNYEKSREVVAHNLACQAIWILQGKEKKCD